MEKVLVTGGAGFIGSNLVDKLVEKGYQVIVIDNEFSDAHEQFYWNDKAENYKYDIRDYELIEPLFKEVKYVFHLAAEARIQPAIADPTTAVEINVIGTCNVLQAARLNNVERVIYSSTSSAYGLVNSPPLREDMPNDCLNPYSVSKVAGEELCRMYSDLFGLKTITFRYFNIYGERQPTKGQYAPVIGLFLRQRQNKEFLTVVGDGLQTRDYTHVSDVVSANIAATKCSEGFGEIYNIGCGKQYSVIDLAMMIGGSLTHIPPRVGESRYTEANIEKSKRVLGWSPEVSLEDWLAIEVKANKLNI
jgi:UDP-glucose 4-epimerase